MVNKNIRWQQRFSNFRKALNKLSEAVRMDFSGLSELEKEGLIQRFEYTYELAWKTLQDFLRHVGYSDIAGPNPVIEQAILDGYLSDAAGWKKMKESRELTSHTYDEDKANEIAQDTVKLFYDLFVQLESRLEVERLR
jgi:nucleotidyltransferase substrate binding protein (TIGR01987 family)